MDFFRKAFLELQHVVWPTKKETASYMTYNIAIIVVMTIFLSCVGLLFQTGLIQAKYIINPASRDAMTNLQQSQSEQQAKELESVYEQFGLSGSTLSGSTNIQESLSGSTTPTNSGEVTENAVNNTETPKTTTES